MANDYYSQGDRYMDHAGPGVYERERRKSMSSGEADAIKVSIEPPNTTERRVSSTTTNQFDSLGHGTSGPTIGHIGWHLPSQTATYTYPLATYVYMYQIRCPKCDTMNFMPLETITPCKKCKSRLKATTQKLDYEVPVEL